MSVPARGTEPDQNRDPHQDRAAQPGGAGGNPAQDDGKGRATVAVARATAPPPGRAVVPQGDDEAPAGKAGRGGDEADGVPESGGLKGRLRKERKLRVIALAAVSLVVLVVLPLFAGWRGMASDPVFTSIDSLAVPAWAAQQPEDLSSGSGWCFLECEFRERTAGSERPAEETAQVYTQALRDAGWTPWQPAGCPDQPITDGSYSCWQRDEFTLDLWVHLPSCAADRVAAENPATVPSVGPDGEIVQPDPVECTGSAVSIKVQNAIADRRGDPESGESPGLTGETPDPVLSNDPLLDPTPEPS